MGKELGQAANVYVDRIPDEDLQLFAQIELAAALSGLPKFRETERGYWGEHPVDGSVSPKRLSWQVPL